MAHWIQACPVQPVNGSCPEPLIWVESVTQVYLTWAGFMQIMPAIVSALLAAWGIRQLLRMILNRR